MSDAKVESPAAANAPANGTKPVERKVVVKSVDMSDEMRTDAIKIITDAFDANTIEKDIAANIKRECDRKFGATWHVIVGRNFGSYVTHETKHFLFLYVDQTAVMIFKSG
ncbi:Dynein light chain Tctex-type [Mycoemilia scoparia]|uniref:Dynein light chain n=1 Tax=Mycoemilia scoparia TaxID=417184 RepID=A0A9W8DML5_9FUNG|nr:Dynein light chain Tctex-type [Mycoemilia scoparia]